MKWDKTTRLVQRSNLDGLIYILKLNKDQDRLIVISEGYETQAEAVEFIRSN